jgi:hypothetical protein
VSSARQAALMASMDGPSCLFFGVLPWVTYTLEDPTRWNLPWTVWAMVGAGTLAMCLLSAGLSFHKVAGIDPGLVFRS